jgi:hypothetical protein
VPVALSCDRQHAYSRKYGYRYACPILLVCLLHSLASRMPQFRLSWRDQVDYAIPAEPLELCQPAALHFPTPVRTNASWRRCFFQVALKVPGPQARAMRTTACPAVSQSFRESDLGQSSPFWRMSSSPAWNSTVSNVELEGPARASWTFKLQVFTS